MYTGVMSTTVDFFISSIRHSANYITLQTEMPTDKKIHIAQKHRWWYISCFQIEAVIAQWLEKTKKCPVSCLFLSRNYTSEMAVLTQDTWFVYFVFLCVLSNKIIIIIINKNKNKTKNWKLLPVWKWFGFYRILPL